jgi:MFS family permease
LPCAHGIVAQFDCSTVVSWLGGKQVDAALTAGGSGRQREFGFGRTANTLLGYTLVKGLQIALYNLIFPLYAYSIGYDQAAIGRLNAVGALTVLVVSVPLGVLADRIGRARLMAIGGLLTPIGLAGIGLSHSPTALIGWMIFQNMTATVYWSALSPLLVGAVAPERRVRAFSINTFCLLGLGSLGSAIGGGVAAGAAHFLGVAPDAVGPLRAAMLLNALIMLLGGLPLWRLRDVSAASDGQGGQALFRLADLRLFGRLLLPDALQAFGAGAIIGFLPLFFSLRFGLEAGVLGWLFTLTGVVGGVSALGAPALARRLGDVRAIGGLMTAVAVAMACTAAAPFVIGAIICETARAALRGTIDPIYTPYAMSRVAAARRGTLGGLYNVTYATGFSLGPILSGWLQVHYGFGPAFAMGAASYVLAASVLWLFFGRHTLAPVD